MASLVAAIHGLSKYLPTPDHATYEAALEAEEEWFVGAPVGGSDPASDPGAVEQYNRTALVDAVNAMIRAVLVRARFNAPAFTPFKNAIFGHLDELKDRAGFDDDDEDDSLSSSDLDDSKDDSNGGGGDDDGIVHIGRALTTLIRAAIKLVRTIGRTTAREYTEGNEGQRSGRFVVRDGELAHPIRGFMDAKGTYRRHYAVAQRTANDEESMWLADMKAGRAATIPAPSQHKQVELMTPYAALQYGIGVGRIQFLKRFGKRLRPEDRVHLQRRTGYRVKNEFDGSIQDRRFLEDGYQTRTNTESKIVAGRI